MTATPRRFATLDVFTDRRLAGNPLAVVLDAEGLADEAMQAIAREFNLSETVFLLPPEAPRHRARLRIFTPVNELPFAGHPTVGSAVLLALEDRRAGRGGDALAFGLEEGVGIVPCVVETDLDAAAGRARFRLPRLPTVWGEPKPKEDLAAALGLKAADIGFDRHVPSRHEAGVPYDLVPVRSREALAAAVPDLAAFRRAFGDSTHPCVYLYTREAEGPGHHFRARMLGPLLGVAEDPATGSAAAAFAGALMQCEPLGEGTHDLVIEQGYEMGRPSEILLQMTVENGALVAAEIGGDAVVVAEGTLRL